MEKPPKHDKFLIFKKNLNLQIHQWPSKVLQKGGIYASPNLNLCKKKPQPLPSYGGLYIKHSPEAWAHKKQYACFSPKVLPVNKQ